MQTYIFTQKSKYAHRMCQSRDKLPESVLSVLLPCGPQGSSSGCRSRQQIPLTPIPQLFASHVLFLCLFYFMFFFCFTAEWSTVGLVCSLFLGESESGSLWNFFFHPHGSDLLGTSRGWRKQQFLSQGDSDPCVFLVGG